MSFYIKSSIKTHMDFLYVLYFIGEKYDINNIGSNYDFTVQIRQ